MTTEIAASFEVTSWNEEPFDERTDGPKVTNAKVTKTYSGELEGDSVTVWLMAYADDGSASFVGIERVNATVAGRTGTFVMQHVGTFANGSATAELSVVAGCGTGGLVGVAGQGDFVADPSGRVRLDLDLP